MNKEQYILISLKTFSSKGTTAMREALEMLAKEFRIVALSSVYSVDRPAESLAGLRDLKKEEHLEGLSVVIHAATEKLPRETIEHLVNIEGKLQSEALKRSVSMNLLVYGSEVLMLPGLSVPHPDMHLRPEEIIPAVEVWPDYIHPVLGESLKSLSRRFVSQKWGEFFIQGRSLLDF